MNATATQVSTETELEGNSPREEDMQSGSTSRALSRGRFPASSSSNTDNSNQVVLRLKVQKKPSVQWAEETVDNEHMGKKTSKSMLTLNILFIDSIIYVFQLFLLYMNRMLYLSQSKKVW
jgi:hypothetical protein